MYLIYVALEFKWRAKLLVTLSTSCQVSQVKVALSFSICMVHYVPHDAHVVVEHLATLWALKLVIATHIP
jgi:3-deoxy-D-manno-octulosonic-acid transferase